MEPQPTQQVVCACPLQDDQNRASRDSGARAVVQITDDPNSVARRWEPTQLPSLAFARLRRRYSSNRVGVSGDPKMTHTPNGGEPTVRRSTNVVYRVGSNQVIVRKVGSGDTALALFGTAAAVWVALDEPATIRELSRRIHDIGARAPAIEEALRLLTAEQLVVAEP